MSNNKRQEDFEKLTLANNFLFGEVMCDEKTGKDILEIILGVDIEKVVVVDKKVYVWYNKNVEKNYQKWYNFIDV